MMKNKTLLALIVACSPTLALAHNLTVGETLPAATIDQHGEILIQQDKPTYHRWKTADMLGKVRVIQAIAGRSAAKEMNAPLMAALTAAEFSGEKYQTTTIINQDDAMWGTGSLVQSSAEDSKAEFPWSSIVLDENGVVAQGWQLQEESSAIIVQDKQGKILFVKEGALSQADIGQVLSLIKQSL